MFRRLINDVLRSEYPSCRNFSTTKGLLKTGTRNRNWQLPSLNGSTSLAIHHSRPSGQEASMKGFKKRSSLNLSQSRLHPSSTFISAERHSRQTWTQRVPLSKSMAGKYFYFLYAEVETRWIHSRTEAVTQ